MTYVEDYKTAVHRPAEEVFDYHSYNDDATLLDDPVFLRDENDQPIGWVLPNVLSGKECDDLIDKAEEFGLEGDKKIRLRTSKRTRNYHDDDLSDLLFPRVRPQLDLNPADKEDYGKLHSLHRNWRIVRYDAGDEFPAHHDQMDSFHFMDKKTGSKDLIVSSHTMLINMSRDRVMGGATRFYPKKSSSPYGYAIDVILPRGWGLVFRQIGLLHAGQPVFTKEDDNTAQCESKYVAQSGVMRVLPRGKLFKPSVFKHGPGVQDLSEKVGISSKSLAYYDDPDRPCLLPPHLA